MGEEILKLICLVPYDLMETKITVEDSQSIIRDALEVIFN